MINPLEKNESRYDHKIAVYNSDIIFSLHGVQTAKKKTISLLRYIRTIKKERNSPGYVAKTTDLKISFKRDSAFVKAYLATYTIPGMEEHNDYWLDDVWTLSLFREKGLHYKYINNVVHASYCGCDGCWRRMLETKPQRMSSLEK